MFLNSYNNGACFSINTYRKSNNIAESATEFLEDVSKGDDVTLSWSEEQFNDMKMALEDGEALASFGFGDIDQTRIENLHRVISGALKKFASKTEG
jgi:hypothetical protein